MQYPEQDYIVEARWLSENLTDPQLRIIDCRINFGLDESGDIVFTSARPDWLSGHVPGSLHVHIVDDLSDRSSDLPFMLPSARDFARSMSNLGVEDGTRVVLYDAFYNIWAARVWWMLRAFGFTNAAVLNGGFSKWTSEGLPLATGEETRPSGSFVANPREGFFVDKQAVLKAIGDSHSCLVDALNADHFTGENPLWVDRPGHIETASNLPYNRIVDPDSHAYLPADELADAITELGLDSGQAAITYCHAGNAASSVAFALALMGHENVAIYDASLREWAADPSLPMQLSANDQNEYS